MRGKLCILSGGMLMTLFALAAPEAFYTESDSLRPVIISGKQIRSESSRQEVQHSRMVKILQPGGNLHPTLTEKKNASDSSQKP